MKGHISDTFQPSQRTDHTATITSSSVHYKQWVLLQHRSRYQSQSGHENKLSTIPSFAATNILLPIACKPVTRIAFTPIILYPATEFHTIYTAMVNFEDVLSQKKMKYGPLWQMKVYIGLQRRFSYSNLKHLTIYSLA